MLQPLIYSVDPLNEAVSRLPMALQPQVEAKTYVELTASTEPSSAAHLLQKALRRCWEQDGKPLAAVHSAEAAEPAYSWVLQAPSCSGAHLVADTLCGHPLVVRRTGHRTVPAAHSPTRQRNSLRAVRSRVDEPMSQRGGASCPQIESG